MKNKILLSGGKKFNKKLKDLFYKKLKDRKRLKGLSFSPNKNASSFKQKNFFVDSQEDTNKIIKENILKFVMGDYLQLKHKIYSFNKKNEQKEKIKETKNFSNEKINYSNLKEILNEFIRDKNKHNDMNSLTKSRIKLDNVNRSIRINRINSILSKISLHFNKAKTKVDIGKKGNDYHEKNFNNLIEKIKESRKKFEFKISNSNRTKSIDIKKMDNIKKFKNKKFIIKTNENYTIKKEDNNLYTINGNNKYINTNFDKKIYLNLFKDIDINIYDKKFKRKKIKLEKHHFEEVNNSNETSLNIKSKERPLTCSRNRNIINENFYKNSIMINKSKNIKRLIKSENKKRSLKVKNLPLYTTKIEDIMNEYYRIKRKVKLAKIHYKENHLLTFNQIDNIVKVKEDLLIFLLKQKFLNSKFPQRFKKKPNKREIFIQKFKDNLDSIDRRYLDNFISI